MRERLRNRVAPIRLALLALAAAAALISLPSTSQVTLLTLATPLSSTTSATYADQPITAVQSAPPQLMLTISRDQQLQYKAYNDYSDLDNDGSLETTYKHSINYYGYFDSFKCYDYDTTNGRFNPASISSTKYCSGNWSGNFLNWVSTTRLDAMRKLLYGGKRFIDTSSLTVLERSQLTSDAHSYAKYYNGADINQLTPFTTISNTPATTTSTTTANLTLGYRNFSVANGTLGAVLAAGDQIKLTKTSDPTRVMYGFVADQTGRSAADRATDCAAGAVASATPAPPNVGTSTTSFTVCVYNTGTAGVNESINNWTLTNLSSAGISFCNVTYSGTSGTDQYSQTTTRPPLLRVARGNFELWGANEGRQCYWHEEEGGPVYFGGVPGVSNPVGVNGNRAAHLGLGAAGFSPRKGTAVASLKHALGSGSNAGASNTADGEFIVRVAACVSGMEGQERCKQYPTLTSIKKPIGLMQVYGDDNRINFGLVTPSYTKNISGGVLRKAISSLNNEINVGTTGVFTGSSGVISSIDNLKMYGYNYSSRGYTGTGAPDDSCTARLLGLVHTGGSNTTGSSQSEGNCSTWGNPIGEAYLESLRMLANKAPNSGFTYTSAGSKDATIGLQLATNVDPLTSANYCANLNVLAFNASVSSYDDDQLNNLSDLGSTQTAKQLTKTIGDLESITGNNFFVGNVTGAPSSSANSCVAKTVTDLGDVTGICPEAPSLLGTYQIAGAAYYAHSNRIRSDITVPSGDTSSLKVTTYGISLATNTPQIVVPVPNSSRKVTLIPALRVNLTDNNPPPIGPGAIVDFRVINQNIAAGTGSFYVNWENSTQGSDYDQDMWGVISYAINTATNSVAVTTVANSLSAGTSISFGYIINGTTQDGLHFHSGGLGNNGGTPSASYVDPTNITVTPTTNLNSSGGCSDCRLNTSSTATYVLGNTQASLLKDPLFYAAKYGGFVDSNGNGRPDLQSEWDSKLADGSPGSDGLPDTYFYVSNPNALEDALRRAFDAILAKTASGTAAAVVSNAREGQGAVYQALYEPAHTDDSGRKATWIGTLQALFIDKLGRLREDDGDKILEETDYAADPVVEAFFDPADRVTKLRRYSGDPAANNFSILPLTSLRTLWNARDQLMNLSDPANQRTYSAVASTRRYIFTNVDQNLNGTVDSGDIVDFAATSFGSTKFGLLNVGTQTDATNLVSYIRGSEVNGMRPRSLDYNSDGTIDVMRLGDIAQSTPTPVGPPSELFNLLYNDTTYAAYAARHQQRRTVVYVGANDGMLHAFNGGFFDNQAKQFRTSLNSETAHPLGAELWAYVPYNLLPHLRWLTENNYGHVYYMDGKPRVFDARIFTPESACGSAGAPTPTASGCLHPFGWGTVMVTGMRFGGGPLDLNSKIAGVVQPGFGGFTNVPNTLKFRSAYVVMDITNPEAPPTVLAELTDTNERLGFTTSLPTVVAFNQRDANSATNTTTTGSATVTDKWYLSFGTGPNDKGTGLSTQTAGVYLYDLKNRAFVSGYTPKSLDAASANSFTGDMLSTDWNFDFVYDALYFGTAGGTAAAPTGRLYKINTNGNSDPTTWGSPEILLNPGAPITAAPTPTLDDGDRRWLYAGTGRFYVQADKSTSAQQTLFGVIDDPSATPAVPPNAAVNYANLVDTTNATVTTSGAVSGVTTPSAVVTESALGALAVTQKGWKYLLTRNNPSERIVTRTSLLGNILFGAAFTPSPTLCEGDGTSRLLGLLFTTGAPSSAIRTFGTNAAGQVNASLDLGQGIAAGVTLHQGTVTNVNDGTITAVIQNSNAALVNTKPKVSVGIKSGEIDWRDSRRSR